MEFIINSEISFPKSSQNTDFRCKITVIPLYQNDGYFLAEDEGFDLIKVLPPSSWRQAALIRAAFRWVRIPLIRGENKNTTRMGGVFILAEDEGFEPPQTESESGVLPLH